MKKYTIIYIAALSALLTPKANAQDGHKHWHAVTSESSTVSIPAKSVITYIGANVTDRNPNIDKITVGNVIYPMSVDNGTERAFFIFNGEIFTDDKPAEISILSKKGENMKISVSYYTMD